MTLREDIIKNSSGKDERGQRADDFFKAYLKDKASLSGTGIILANLENNIKF